MYDATITKEPLVDTATIREDLAEAGRLGDTPEGRQLVKETYDHMALLVREIGDRFRAQRLKDSE